MLQGAKRVVDLAAAPGSWSQVIADRLADDEAEDGEERIVVAVDVQPMQTLAGVTQV